MTELEKLRREKAEAECLCLYIEKKMEKLTKTYKPGDVFTDGERLAVILTSSSIEHDVVALNPGIYRLWNGGRSYVVKDINEITRAEIDTILGEEWSFREELSLKL